jgi:predicted RNA-binding Zn ribbon-like protein
MPDATADQLSSAAGFGEWLSGPGLPAPAGGLTDDDLSSARTLRAAIAAAARRLVADESVEPADVRCINSYARRPTPVFLLRPGGRGRAVVEEVDATAALSVIARDAVHLLTSSGAGRLRACAREGCSTLFFDRSPSGRRRWCSMKGCGELVAAASYRRRRAEAAR